MILEDKFRSFVRIFWFLPLIAAPSLIMWGYYEAHRDTILSYGGVRSVPRAGNVRVGESPGCSLGGKSGHEQCNASGPVPRDPPREGQSQILNNEESTEDLLKRDADRRWSLPESHRIQELAEKGRKLEKKIKKRKQMLAQLREEQESVNTKICERKELAPVGSRPAVALASLPGSGNTWVRHLLESASGLYTGSVYSDKRLFRAGFFGEYEDPWSGTILVIKSHKFKPEVAHHFDTAIVLVRNPYKAMISEYNRKLTGRNHTAVANQTDFTGEEWYTFVRSMGDKWLGVVQKWLQKDSSVHIVYYEEIISNTRTELGKMLKFLNIEVDTARMDCTIANQEGSFHRKSRKEFDPYTTDQKIYINSKIERARETLAANRKPALPTDYSAEVPT